MNNSIELAIAQDFLTKFSRTETVSKYSPKASTIVRNCQLSYPPFEGGVYPLKKHHIMTVAESLGIAVQKLTDGNALIGISAKEINDRKIRSVYTESLVCRHGFSRYTFILDEKMEPRIKPICSKCSGGFEPPSEFEIAQANSYLKREIEFITPWSGSLIIAARELGHKVTLTMEGKFSIKSVDKKTVTKTGAVNL